MNLIRRATIGMLAAAFCLSPFAFASYAQPGRARWEGNRGLHRGWTQGRHRGWNRRLRTADLNRDGRVSGWERRRLARQRMRIYNSSSRFLRDGYLSPWERRQLMYRNYRYRQSANRFRRTW